MAGAGLERVGLQLRRRKEEEGAQSVDAILLHTKIRGETANKSLAITFKKSIACRAMTFVVFWLLIQ